MKKLFTLTIIALFGLIPVFAQSESPKTNYFERNGISIKFPDKYKTTENKAEKKLTVESPDGAVKFYLIATTLDNFDEVNEQFFQKFLAESFTGATKVGENNHERGNLALRIEEHTAKAKADQSEKMVLVQFAITIPTDGAKALLLISVCPLKPKDEDMGNIGLTFTSEVKIGETPLSSPKESESAQSKITFTNAAFPTNSLLFAPAILRNTCSALADQSPFFASLNYGINELFSVFSGGDACTDKCNEKRQTCDRSCDQKRLLCIAQCGLPIQPGYDKCTQRCNDDQSRCSLQCQAEQKVCEVKCKVGS